MSDAFLGAALASASCAIGISIGWWRGQRALAHHLREKRLAWWFEFEDAARVDARFCAWITWFLMPAKWFDRPEEP